MNEPNFDRTWRYRFLDVNREVITEMELDGDQAARDWAADLTRRGTQVKFVQRWVPSEDVWRDLPPLGGKDT